MLVTPKQPCAYFIFIIFSIWQIHKQRVIRCEKQTDQRNFPSKQDNDHPQQHKNLKYQIILEQKQVSKYKNIKNKIPIS